MKFKLILVVFILLFTSCSSTKQEVRIEQLEDRMDLLEDWMFYIENDLLIEDMKE